MIKVGKPHIYTLPPNEVRILNRYAQKLQQDAEKNGEDLLPLINLLIGEPDFPTPEHIKNAAIEAIQQQAIGYGPAAGWPWLKELIAEKIRSKNGYRVEEDHVAITVGGTGAVQAAFLATLQEGDEVLIPDPGWPQYQLQLSCCGAKPVHYPLMSANGWLPDVAQLEQLLTPRSRMIVINSPANPSGAVFPTSLIAELLDFALRHNLYLLSDECYDEITFEQMHVSPASFLSTQSFENGNIICIYSFSKTYSMTGWRIGYVVSSKKLIQTITNVLDSSHTNISTLIQHAAAAALCGPQNCVQVMRMAYHQRRDCAIALLKEQQRFTYTPQGAFYILIDISNAAEPYRQGKDFAHALLQKRHVAVAPGTSFGNTIPQFVRVSLAAKEQDIAHGIRNLCMFE